MKNRLKPSLLGLALICAAAFAISFGAWTESAPEAPIPDLATPALATSNPAMQPNAPTRTDEPAGTGSAPETSAPASEAYEPDTVLITLATGVSADELIASILGDSPLAGLAVAREGEGYVKLALPAGVTVENALAQLEESQLVEGAQPNYRYHTLDAAPSSAAVAPGAGTPALTLAATSTGATTLAPAAAAALNDTYYARQWALASVNAPAAWSLVAAHVGTSSPVTIAVIDNGFLVKHEDLAAHVIDYYNASKGSTSMGTDHATHGTHVAGIVGAVANNGKGVAGATGNTCGLMLLRVSDSHGEITTDTIVDAYSYLVKHAKTHNVRVVNMSLGAESSKPVGRSTDPAFYDAIAKARKAGVVTVVAACNSDVYSPPFYAMPADFDNVVSVINLEQQANTDGVGREWSSNYNVAGQKAKAISAPGTGIVSLGGKVATYRTEDGTSMASPLVAGVLGLMFTVNPKLTASQATNLLYASARDLAASAGTTAGWDDATGYGEVDAEAAVRAAGATTSAAGRANIARGNVTVSHITYKRGKARKPTVKVVLGGTTLRKGVDFTVKYRDNKSAGKAAVAVVGKGAYCGIAVGAFTIKKAKLKKAALKATAAVADGRKHKPAVKWVKIASGKVKKANYKVTYWRNGHKTTDFKSPGTIKVKITGKTNCKGTLTKTFHLS